VDARESPGDALFGKKGMGVKTFTARDFKKDIP
jgi:hypothetical protein